MEISVDVEQGKKGRKYWSANLTAGDGPEEVSPQAGSKWIGNPVHILDVYKDGFSSRSHGQTLQIALR
jgi:hypothetical protein